MIPPGSSSSSRHRAGSVRVRSRGFPLVDSSRSALSPSIRRRAGRVPAVLAGRRPGRRSRRLAQLGSRRSHQPGVTALPATLASCRLPAAGQAPESSTAQRRAQLAGPAQQPQMPLRRPARQAHDLAAPSVPASGPDDLPSAGEEWGPPGAFSSFQPGPYLPPVQRRPRRDPPPRGPGRPGLAAGRGGPLRRLGAAGHRAGHRPPGELGGHRRRRGPSPRREDLPRRGLLPPARACPQPSS